MESYPNQVVLKGRKYSFDMVAPITKDAIYKNVDHTQTVRYALLVREGK